MRPRGRVPVAFEVPAGLELPLHIWGVRKLASPLEPEVGLGAVAEGGGLFIDRSVSRQLGLEDDDVADILRRCRDELASRTTRLREGAGPHDLRGKSLIVVDDGIANGGTVRAAVDGLRQAGTRSVVVAVPVAPRSVLRDLYREGIDVVCRVACDQCGSVGRWYREFPQVPDDQVISLVRTRGRSGGGPACDPLPALRP